MRLTNGEFHLGRARGCRREGPGGDLRNPEGPGGRTKQLRPHHWKENRNVRVGDKVEEGEGVRSW